MKAEEPMTKLKLIYLISALNVLLLASACDNQSNSGALDTVATKASELVKENTGEDAASPITSESPNSDTSVTKPENEASEDNPAEADSEQKIEVIIDQTEKPIEGNSFDFTVKQLPKGFSLVEMQWVSKQNLIINSVGEAIEHGASGGDGFYISGNGQFSGFFYPYVMKGEKGKLVLTFKDEQDKVLTWEKEITLK